MTSGLWRLANYLRTMGEISGYQMAFVAQTLAILGIGGALNQSIWTKSVFTLATSVDIIYIVIMAYSFGLVSTTNRSADATEAT